MNFKRGKPKSTRAGCLLCKPYKAQTSSKAKARRAIGGKGGFGKLRAEIAAEADWVAEVAQRDTLADIAWNNELDDADEAMWWEQITRNKRFHEWR